MALRVVFILYCIEAGLFFVLAPWTRFWTGNPLFSLSHSLTALSSNPWVRGMVSGFGLIHLMVGFREFIDMMAAWRSGAAARGR